MAGRPAPSRRVTACRQRALRKGRIPESKTQNRDHGIRRHRRGDPHAGSVDYAQDFGSQPQPPAKRRNSAEWNRPSVRRLSRVLDMTGPILGHGIKRIESKQGVVLSSTASGRPPRPSAPKPHPCPTAQLAKAARPGHDLPSLGIPRSIGLSHTLTNFDL